jgi:hypothetical protein
MAILLGRRRFGGCWEVLAGHEEPTSVSPTGAWDTLLLVKPGLQDERDDDGLTVQEFVVPAPQWREIERESR